MASFTNIFISITAITAIIAIGGEAAIRPLTLPGPRVPYHEKTSDTRSTLAPIVTDQDKFNMTWPLPLRAKLDVQTSPILASKTFTGPTVDQHESQKERQPEPVKTTGAGSGSVTSMKSPIGSILPFNLTGKKVIPPKRGVEYWRELLKAITAKGFQESVLKTRLRRSAPNISFITNGTATVHQETTTRPANRIKLRCYIDLLRIVGFVFPDEECLTYFQEPSSSYS